MKKTQLIPSKATKLALLLTALAACSGNPTSGPSDAAESQGPGTPDSTVSTPTDAGPTGPDAPDANPPPSAPACSFALTALTPATAATTPVTYAQVCGGTLGGNDQLINCSCPNAGDTCPTSSPYVPIATVPSGCGYCLERTQTLCGLVGGMPYSCPATSTCMPLNGSVSGFACCPAGQTCTSFCAGVCAPGSRICANNGVATCGNDDQPGAPTTACPGQTCVDAGCTGVCEPGTPECSDGGLVNCNSNGQWDFTPCRGAPCVQGVCVTSCDAGSTRCQGNDVVTCGANSSWGSPVGCTVTGETCDAGVCVCPSENTMCDAGCFDLLTDSSNCGACGNACAGTCTQGRCLTVLAAQQNGAYGLAVQGGTVYWSNNNDGTVMAISASGGTPVTLATGQNDPRSVALNSTTVYWTNYAAGQVMSLPMDGGVSPTTIASGQLAPSALAVADQVFWLVNGDSTDGTSKIMALPVDGGSLVQWGPTSYAGGGGSYYWGLAAEGSTAYWTGTTSYDGDDVVSASGPSAPVVLVGGVQLPGAVAYFDGRVYVTNSNPTTSMVTTAVASVSADGGISSYQRIADGPQGVIRQSIAVDGLSVYWSNSDGSIVRAPIGGGTPTTLATGQGVASDYNSDTQRLAVDATSVYWTDAHANTVLKLTPK